MTSGRPPAAAYGVPVGDVDVVPVDDPDVARLLALAHARVHGEPAAVSDGATIEPVAGPPAAERWVEPDGEVVERLAAAHRPVVLAGPGVVAAGCVPGLHALAAAGSLGVLNTWGAKGIFHWRSRHHLATAGLQARDFELGGLADADLVLAVGLDPLEAPAGLLPPLVTVPPGALGPLAERWSRPARAIEVPPLRSGLAAVTQDGWASTAVPLAPSLVTRHYGGIGRGGLVAADPGRAGYWVARTFATTELGGVVVPAEADRAGFAAACALVARRRDPGRPVLAVADAVPEAVLEVARALGVAVPVEVWTPEGEQLDVEAHRRRLAALVAAPTATVATLATDPTQLDRMVEVAGPVVAWRPAAGDGAGPGRPPGDA